MTFNSTFYMIWLLMLNWTRKHCNILIVLQALHWAELPLIH